MIPNEKMNINFLWQIYKIKKNIYLWYKNDSNKNKIIKGIKLRILIEKIVYNFLPK
jgi:hypothetical protein